jgi:hypothetical protein
VRNARLTPFAISARRLDCNGMSPNATARRFRRKVSDEMQVRLPAQTTHAKGGDRGGIGGQVFPDAHSGIILSARNHYPTSDAKTWIQLSSNHLHPLAILSDEERNGNLHKLLGHLLLLFCVSCRSQ